MGPQQVHTHACQDKSASAHVQKSVANNSAERWSLREAYAYHLRSIEWRDRHLSYVVGSNYRYMHTFAGAGAPALD